MIGLVLGNGFLITLVIIELILLKFIYKEKIPWGEIVTNLNSGHILMWILRGVELYAYYFTYQHFSMDLFNQLPIWLQWIIGYLAWDFCFYWLHRLHHKIELFWNIHVVHHEGEHFSLSLGIRNSWYSSLSSFPFFAGLAILGLPFDIFLGVSSINYFIQFYNHNRIVNKSGILEYLFVTPSHHRVHHGKNKEYIDKNFGGTFIIWDKLFGTYQQENANIEIQYGVNNSVKSMNTFWINNIPFLKSLNIKIPSLEKNQNVQLSQSWIGMGSFVLFALLLYFIFIEHSWFGWNKWALFGIIFCGSIANGLLFENTKIGYWFWFLIACIANTIYFISLKNIDKVLIFLLILFFIHGFFTLLKSLKNDESTI